MPSPQAWNWAVPAPSTARQSPGSPAAPGAPPADLRAGRGHRPARTSGSWCSPPRPGRRSPTLGPRPPALGRLPGPLRGARSCGLIAADGHLGGRLARRGPAAATTPRRPSRGRGPLVAVAVVAVGLYAVAAWRYSRCSGARGSTLMLSVAAAFVLLAEAAGGRRLLPQLARHLVGVAPAHAGRVRAPRCRTPAARARTSASPGSTWMTPWPASARSACSSPTWPVSPAYSENRDPARVAIRAPRPCSGRAIPTPSPAGPPRGQGPRGARSRRSCLRASSCPGASPCRAW